MGNDFYTHEYWNTTLFVNRVMDGAYDTEPRNVSDFPPLFPTVTWSGSPTVNEALDYREALELYLIERRGWEEDHNCPEFLKGCFSISRKFWKDCKEHFNLTEHLDFDNAILELVKEKPVVRYKEFYDRLVELRPIIEAHRKALEDIRMQ